MPPIQTLKTLVVHLNFWQSPGQPRYLITTSKGPCPCKSLDVARKFAREHGFSGIHVQPQ